MSYLEELHEANKIRQAKFYQHKRNTSTVKTVYFPPFNILTAHKLIPLQEKINRTRLQSYERQSIRKVSRVVFNYYGFNRNSRGYLACEARNIVYYICMVIYGFSCPKVAKYCGFKCHHTTVLRGRDTIKKRLTTKRELAIALIEIRKKL